jgi:hypothetical protein
MKALAFWAAVFNQAMSVRGFGGIAVALGLFPAAFAQQRIELDQNLRLRPGTTASATIPSQLAEPAVVVDAPQIVQARIQNGSLKVTAARAGTAKLTFTASRVTGLLGSFTGAAESPSTSIYSLRETITVEVLDSRGTSQRSPDPPALTPILLRFQRTISLNATAQVQARIPSNLQAITVQVLDPAAAQAAVDSGMFHITAGNAAASTQVTVSGAGPRSFLHFEPNPIEERASANPLSARTKYRFEEVTTVRVTTNSTSSPPLGAAGARPGFASNPNGLDKKGTQHKIPDGQKTGDDPSTANGDPKGSNEPKKDRKDDDNSKSATNPASTSQKNLSIRVGDTSTAALPAHTRVFTAKSANETCVSVVSKDDQVKITGLKPGTSDVTLTGEAISLEIGLSSGLGTTPGFTLVIHVQVTGLDLSGQWTYGNGNIVTIEHTGSKVVLRDIFSRPWEGTLSGDKVDLSHTYAKADVGLMGNQWPEKVQTQLVGKRRRYSGTVSTDNTGTITIIGTLYGIDPHWNSNSEDVTSVAEQKTQVVFRKIKTAAADTSPRPGR